MRSNWQDTSKHSDRSTHSVRARRPVGVLPSGRKLVLSSLARLPCTRFAWILGITIHLPVHQRIHTMKTTIRVVHLVAVDTLSRLVSYLLRSAAMEAVLSVFHP